MYRDNVMITDICYDILCTFQIESDIYAIIANDDLIYYNYEIRKASWNPWYGVRWWHGYDDKEVKRIAELLLDCHKKDSSNFIMYGEHYYVRKKEGGGYSVSRAYGNRYSNTLHQATVAAPRLLIALAFAHIAAFLLAGHVCVSWALILYPNVGYKVMFHILCAIEFGGTLLIFFRDKDRSIANMLINSCFPLCAAVILITMRANLAYALFVIAVFLLFCVFPSVAAKLYDKYYYVSLFKLAKEIKISHKSYIVVLFALALVFGVKGYSYDANEENGFDVEKYHLSCVKLEPDKWSAMTTDEKADVLQTICDYECVFELGCKTALLTVSDDLDDDCVGKYSPEPNIIYINSKFIKESTAHEILEAVLHETRHAWQNLMVDMYNDIEDELDDKYKKLSVFVFAQKLRENDANYIPSSDYEAYKNQIMERDSREWAAIAMLRYAECTD